MKVATHDGSFHADEVFAIAILKLIHPKLEVIRTRDSKELEKADLRVDVGGTYNYKKGDFDHHQKSFTETRKNGIPYASAGLLWLHFGKELVNSQEAFDYVDSEILQPIDAHDNGIENPETEYIPYSIQKVIRTFYPSWKSKNQDYDKAFLGAVDFAQSVLKKEIEFANSLKEGKEIILRAVKESGNEYLIFEKEPPKWHDFLVDYPRFKYAIYQSSNGDWRSVACRLEKGSLKIRKPFPRGWAGLSGEELVEKTGVQDALFCHKNLFIVSAKSKQGVVALTGSLLVPRNLCFYTPYQLQQPKPLNTSILSLLHDSKT